MGYAVNWSGCFTAPATDAGRAAVNDAADRFRRVGHADVMDEDTAAANVVGAIAEALRLEGYWDAVEEDGNIVIVVDGRGTGDGDYVCAVMAAAGIDGDIEGEGEDGQRWRTVSTGGQVRHDPGQTVYAGDLPCGLWIAQLQAIDEGDFDRVGFASSERKARALVAQWVREQVPGIVADGILPAGKIHTEADDETLLTAWGAATAARWQIRESADVA
ncbi:MAG: hypothetical protein L0H59_07010 [Tomitella sp.]|nr:hypothetical protein [Tomitella sp.]